MNDLTPAQATWGKFYFVLHQEIERLEKLVEKKTTTKDVTHQDAPLVVAQERQSKTSVSKDSNRH